jgi:hypothetical protein
MSELAKVIAEAMAAGPVAQDHKCKFCGKGFIKESTLSAHLCEPKRRSQQRDEVGVRLGFNAWIKFYELTQGSAKTKTYDDFADGPYYKAFVKFGRHLHSIRAINPAAFTEWVIKNNKKLDQWTKDAFYNEYLLSHLKRENPQDALERGIVEMQAWADEHDSIVNHFFLYASPTRLCMMIANGRISPWLIYCSDSGLSALEKLSSEQIAMVYPWIDPEYWQRKLKDYAADAEWCKHVLKQAGF